MSMSTPHRYALDRIDNPDTNTAGLLYGGDAGDNTQSGTNGDDGFDYSQGGNDTLNGLDGQDEFDFGGAYNYLDHVDGGAGYDRLVLDGNYRTGSVTQLSTASLQNVEEIDFRTGHSYDIFMSDGNVKAGEHLVFDATALKASNGLFIDSEFESDGAYTIYGGNGADEFLLGAGQANAYGGSGGDFMSVHSNALANKLLAGNGGTDTLAIVYSSSDVATLGSGTMSGFERLAFSAKSNLGDVTLSLYMDNGNLGAGELLQVIYFSAGNTNASLFFDGHAELDGRFDIQDYVNNDTFTGGQKNDIFRIIDGGDDFVLGQGGDDTIYAGAYYNSSDTFNGEFGKDTLVLDGDYSGNPTLMTFTNIETLRVTDGHSYRLEFADNVVAAGEKLKIDGADLQSSSALIVDGTGETDGSFTMTGGNAGDTLSGGAKNDILAGNAGNDSLNGGDGNDTLNGGAGNDVLTGLGGADTLVLGDGKDAVDCGSESQSTGRRFDSVVGFDFGNTDKFTLGMSSAVTGIDAKIAGADLSKGNFNADLAAALTAGKLAAHHAVLFTPGGTGPYAGETFLIVDANGNAGYQANKDYVFLLEDSLHLNQLNAADFALAN